jgi:hypothetical protein
MDRAHCGPVVWGRRPHRRSRLRHGGLVSQWAATGAVVLGADPRAAGALRPPGAAVHRPRRHPGADPGLVHLQRWQVEVTFEEARRHLGLETQRQWSAAAIRRTTPALLGLFSLVTLLAHRQMREPGGGSPPGRLVSQARSDLCRCAGAGPARGLAAPDCSHIPLRRGGRGNPAPRARTLVGDAVLRRLKGSSRA